MVTLYFGPSAHDLTRSGVIPKEARYACRRMHGVRRRHFIERKRRNCSSASSSCCSSGRTRLGRLGELRRRIEQRAKGLLTRAGSARLPSRPASRPTSANTSSASGLSRAGAPLGGESLAQLEVTVRRLEDASDDQLRRGRPVPAVLLEPERQVVGADTAKTIELRPEAESDRAAGAGGRGRARGSGGVCPPPPSPRSVSSHAATSRLTPGIAEAEGGEPARARRRGRA